MKDPRKGRVRAFAASAAVVIIFVLVNAGAATAVSTADHERKLNDTTAMLDKAARQPNGEKAVVDRLAKTFNIPADRIAALKDRTPGYGEIAVLLTIADKMAGGLTNPNINKVLTLRQAHKGWGEIARSVDVKIGSVVNRMDAIGRDANRDVLKAAAEKPGSGQGAGGERRRARQ